MQRGGSSAFHPKAPTVANAMNESRSELMAYKGSVTFSPAADWNSVLQFFTCALDKAYDSWKAVNPEAKLVKAKLMIFDPATERPIPSTDTTTVGWLVIARVK